MVTTLELIVTEDKGGFTTDPESLENFRYTDISELLNSFRPESRSKVNNIEFDAHTWGEFETLTPKQTEVAYYIAQGLRNDAIGSVLGIATRTVERHIGGISKNLRYGNHLRSTIALEFRSAFPHLFPVPDISLPDLTGRETEVAELIGKGYNNSNISRAMRISDRTVERHVNGIFNKLNYVMLKNHHPRVAVAGYSQQGLFEENYKLDPELGIWKYLKIPDDQINEENTLELQEKINEALSPRQLKVLGYIARGFNNDYISQEMGVQSRTTEAHISAITQRFGRMPEEYNLRVSLMNLYNTAIGEPRDFDTSPTIITNAEYGVAKLVSQGLSNNGIANELTIAPRTVEHHVASIIQSVSYLTSESDHNRAIIAMLYNQGKLMEKHAFIRSFDSEIAKINPLNYLDEVDDKVPLDEPDEEPLDTREPNLKLELYLEQTLTEREFEVLSAIASGLNNSAIGEKLFIQQRTVERHIGSIFSGLQVTSHGYHGRASSIVLYDTAFPSSLVSSGGETIYLTPTQNKVSQLIGSGYNNEEIASRLGIMQRTLERHIGAIAVEVSDLLTDETHMRANVVILSRQGLLKENVYEVDEEIDSINPVEYLSARNNGEIEIPNPVLAQYLRQSLTTAEFEVLGHIATGLNNEATAQWLEIETRTVEHHISAILSTLSPPLEYHPRVYATSIYQIAFDPEGAIEPEKEIPLTEREFEVADLVAQGFNNVAIGDQLFIQSRTVEHHMSSILSKLEITTPEFVHQRVIAADLYNRGFIYDPKDNTMQTFFETAAALPVSCYTFIPDMLGKIFNRELVK